MLAEHYYTISQAAKRVGVTRQTISRWLDKELLPSEKVGREKLILRHDLDNLEIRCPTCRQMRYYVKDKI